MKHFIFYLSMLAVLLPVLYSCTSGDFAIGESIQPVRDTVWTATSVYTIKSKTVKVDSILQRNEYAILGQYTDPVFGTTKSDFAMQVYCPDDFKFNGSGTVINGRIDSAYLYMFFDDFYGDSLSLFEASVYHLSKKLDLNKLYYTNLDIAGMCEGKSLGKKAYTVTSAVNEWNTVYDYCIRIPIDRSFAQQIYDDNVSHPEYFSNLESFTDYFKGLYIATTYGNGTFVHLADIELELIYQFRYTSTNSSGVEVSHDTTAASYFLSTKEVRQVNTYQHKDLSRYISTGEGEKDSINYVYAPAGLYTRIELPLKQLYKDLATTNINYSRIKMTATDINNESQTVDKPEQLLLVNESDVNSFFASYSLADKYSTFSATYSESDTCYTFDVSPLIQKYIRKWDEDSALYMKTDPDTVLELLVVPMTEIQNADNTSLYVVPETDPCAVKIRSACHPTRPMKLEVIASKQNL